VLWSEDIKDQLINSKKRKTSAVPVNVITGFLGAGKTTAILHLLTHKPEHESWAVLVNEFGEIGVDGSLFKGRHSERKGVVIREVPGGCMCCAAGLPMQIALSQLLAVANLDRLLIEPTGLGHPKEVLDSLSAKHYQNTLSLQKTITLIDSRKLRDLRITQNDIYKQQIDVADTIVGSKVDLYNDGDKERLLSYVKKRGKSESTIIFAEQGQIALSDLDGATAYKSSTFHQHSDESNINQIASDLPMPECGFIKATNEAEGFMSVGWRFSPDKVFNRVKLTSLLTDISAERIKAVFITSTGVFGYNATPDALSEVELDDCLESCVEIISDEINDRLEARLLDCVS
jgi:G3E family GTPase